jgi:predicted KAP-like P-loop ATPase
MTNVDPPEKPPIDSPIRSTREDALLRSPVAHEFAETIRELDSSEGLVIGVLGPWGFGKSSFINLMREQFALAPKMTVIDFNPWMFSGYRQLVDFFFTEIAAELKVKDRKRFGAIADWLNEYSGILSPVAGFIPIPGATLAAEAVQKAAAGVAATTNADRSTRELRDKLTKSLADLDQPILVVIDDIDRLTSVEIREIFKLVRLTASFPNVIYLLAFDRDRVEKALDEDGIPGRAYLEKIVQLSFDVPQIPDTLLRSKVFDELNRVLGGINDDQLDQSRWADVYFELIDPLLHNMRDVTRYALSARSTVRGLTGEVDLVDVLALEAIRVFRPELFATLTKMRLVLTSVQDSAFERKESKHKVILENLIQEFDADGGLVRDLIRNLFPAGRQHIENYAYGQDSLIAWRKDHRVAHVDFLSLYLDRSSPSELVAFRVAEKAHDLFSDAKALDSYLRSVEPTLLEDVMQGLEAYQQVYLPESVVPASVTLLNLIDAIPERPVRGMFDLGRPDLAVGRVVLRLMRRSEDESQREAWAAEILKDIDTYSSRFDFITTIGYMSGAGHKLVSEEFAARVEQEFADQVMATRPANPEREWDALRVYYFLANRGIQAPLGKSKDVDVISVVLRSARSVNRSQTAESRSVKTEEVLAWDPLLKVFGTENEIKSAAKTLRKANPKSPILPLVDRYLSGWRPNSF